MRTWECTLERTGILCIARSTGRTSPGTGSRGRHMKEEKKTCAGGCAGTPWALGAATKRSEPAGSPSNRCSIGPRSPWRRFDSGRAHLGGSPLAPIPTSTSAVASYGTSSTCTHVHVHVHDIRGAGDMLSPFDLPPRNHSSER